MRFLKKISPLSAPDAALVAEYKKTERLEVLSDLYQRYFELVYGVCLKYLSDEEASRDAVMNIFEELIVKLKTHEVDHFKAWLHTLAKNHCLMQLRTAKKIKLTGFNEEIMQIEENVHLNGVMEKESQLERMTICMKTLPGEQQQCVELFYLQNKSYNEISDLTGFDWKSVRSYIQNGRRNLKICMDKYAESVDIELNTLGPNLQLKTE